LWSEKGTVRGLLAPVIKRYQIPFRAGPIRILSVNDVADQIEVTTSSGKAFVALYCGDWDPSGLDMSEWDLPNRLERYSGGTNFTLERIALIESDLAELPSFPLESKKDDPRADWYRRNYNPRVCWELDAMKPGELRERVEGEILNYIDQELWERADMVEKAERESIREFASALKSLGR